MIDRSIEVNNLQREAELAKLKPEFGIQYNHMTGWAHQPAMFSSNGHGTHTIGKLVVKNE